jgi:hypothetical protein
MSISEEAPSGINPKGSQERKKIAPGCIPLAILLTLGQEGWMVGCALKIVTKNHDAAMGHWWA